ncbi:YlbF family regulator [Tumebacillus lipolyticus]|uniref:YlbF family regulator n=1 Tax=Tumebacillus lipolyticus TaxID=1280370 RepID=A0ABW4ZVM3_9BACL
MNPYDKAHELARALTGSQEYQLLQRLKARVDADASARKVLDDFRRRQWELETRRLMGEEITGDDIERVTALQEALSLHATAREYLEAEYRFGLIYSDIHKIIGEAVSEVIAQPER